LTIVGVVDYLRTRDLHWTALFPSLQRSEEARRDALAELETAGVSLFFHGHTHVQEAWLWRPAALPSRLDDSEFMVPEDGSRVLVGVGSVGDARDGGGACYALYDEGTRQVIWRRV
jgi:diadenosine tetraphosphatase ApaH/serine/threonine PP2A family protein phosphatase